MSALSSYLSYEAVAVIAFALAGIVVIQWVLLWRGRGLNSDLHADVAALNAAKAAEDVEKQSLVKQIALAEQKLLQFEQRLADAQTASATKDSQLAAAAVRQQESAKQYAEQIKLLNEAREQLKLEFESVANKIFEEKSNSFAANNKKGLDQTLLPLKEQLSEFKKKVEDVYDKESKERVSLLHEIGTLRSLNQQISQDAINLTKALKADNKAQGNWGEIVLERVLEESGLRKDHEYEVQASFRQEDGRRFQPDVVVHLPEGKDVIVDSKVSLVDYERYCSAENDADKKAALEAHIASMKAHIKGISAKNYESLNNVRTLDFILVFVPIEPAFLLAFEQDGKLFSEAYDRNVIIVSPTTLLAVLRTVQSLWRYERQNQNADEIARIAGTLYDKISGVAESLGEVGRHLDNAHKAQETTFNRLKAGKGNLVSTAQRLEKLGAKTKKPLPKHIISEENED